MKKKIKDLSEKQVSAICNRYGLYACSDKCPLHRVENNRMRLCMNIGECEDYEDYKFTKKELEALEQEIEVEDDE